MRPTRIIQGVALALALVAWTSPAGAQGKGKGHDDQGKGRGNAEHDQGNAGRKEHGRANAGKEQRQRNAARGERGERGERDQGKNAAKQAKQAEHDARKAEKLTGRENAALKSRAREAAGGEVVRVRPPVPERARFIRTIEFGKLKPAVRTYVISPRYPEQLVGRVVAIGFERGLDDNAFVIAPTRSTVLVRNQAGLVLLDLDENRAAHLGAWRVVPFEDRVDERAPSFCRSGAGHPVWGRQWCLDKGFGLGSDAVRWGQAMDLGDVVFRQPSTTEILTREVLARVLGTNAVDRLAAHAITLGLVDPLVGQWLGDQTGPQVLLVSSGNQPVAELVDVNRDRRADRMYVALRPW